MFSVHTFGHKNLSSNLFKYIIIYIYFIFSTILKTYNFLKDLSHFTYFEKDKIDSSYESKYLGLFFYLKRISILCWNIMFYDAFLFFHIKEKKVSWTKSIKGEGRERAVLTRIQAF